MERFIHRRTMHKNGTKEWTICKGEEVKVFDLTLYHVENVDFGGVRQSALIEPQTGLSLSMGTNKRECIKNAKAKLEEIGIDKFNEIIVKQIEKDGYSPSYLKATYNPVRNAQ